MDSFKIMQNCELNYSFLYICLTSAFSLIWKPRVHQILLFFSPFFCSVACSLSYCQTLLSVIYNFSKNGVLVDNDFSDIFYTIQCWRQWKTLILFNASNFVFFKMRNNIAQMSGSFNNLITVLIHWPGTFRLDNGYHDSSQASGVLRIYQNSTWGYVCDDLFTERDAQMFCSKVGQAMGYNYSVGLKSAGLKNVLGPYFSINPYCSSSANGDYQCTSSRNVCSGRRAVTLICAEKISKCSKSFYNETCIFRIK